MYVDVGVQVGWNGTPEVIEGNNYANITARFCGWGPELHAGQGIRFHSTNLARWAGRHLPKKLGKHAHQCEAKS
jgi:hypothetical protein